MSEYKAYTVTDIEHSVIVFAKSGIAARRIGAGELNIVFEYVESCRRTHWADQYAAMRKVPPKAYIDNGWWMECGECGTHVSSDGYNYDRDEPLYPVYQGDWVFCSPLCKHNHEEEKRQIREDEERARAIVAEKFPGCEMVHKDYRKDRVVFTFPGGERSVSWEIGEDMVTISVCDTISWNAYRESTKEGNE